MKGKILIVSLFALLAVALSGCTQPAEPVAVYQYVCTDGTVVSSVSQCAPGTAPNLDELCAGYCTAPTNGGSPELTEEYIRSEIDKANYCSTVDDCGLANRKCPFGCYILVNRTKVDHINSLTRDFSMMCMLTCTPMEEYTCHEGKCKPVVFGEVWDSY